MNDQEIKALLDKYDNGLTTAREERLLEEALLGDVPESLGGEAAYFQALHALQEPLSAEVQNLEEKLSKEIDQWNVVERASGRKARRMSLRVVGLVAASLLLLFSLGVFLNNRQAQPAAITEQTDTFNNPQDAQAAAGKALAKFSTALNKGLDKMNNKDYNH